MCITHTKLPSSVDLIRRTSLSFSSWCPEITRPLDLCFQATSVKISWYYGGLYQHTPTVSYVYWTIQKRHCWKGKFSVCSMCSVGSVWKNRSKSHSVSQTKETSWRACGFITKAEKQESICHIQAHSGYAENGLRLYICHFGFGILDKFYSTETLCPLPPPNMVGLPPAHVTSVHECSSEIILLSFLGEINRLVLGPTDCQPIRNPGEKLLSENHSPLLHPASYLHVAC